MKDYGTIPVNETRSHKARYAVQLHFSSWCRCKGIECPISETQLKKLYAMDDAGFRAAFQEIAMNCDARYPVNDADAFAANGTDGTPSLAICCQAADIDPQDVMDLLFQ